MSNSELNPQPSQTDPNQATQTLFHEICQIIDKAKQTTATAINTEIANLYQQTGQKKPASKLSLKSPEVLDFLGLRDPDPPKNIKDTILQDLEQYLLDRDTGFASLGRQKRPQINNDDLYIDLLLYNRKLKRLIAIDLKLVNFRHEYKSQMELYLRWLEKYEQEPDEQPPLGIILCKSKKTRAN